MGLKTQVKGMIHIFMSILIAISIAFIKEYTLCSVIFIVISFIVEILLLFIRSDEEKYFDKKVKHMQDMEYLDHQKDEKAKEIKNKEEIQKMKDKAKKVTESKPNYSERQQYINMRRLLEMRGRR